jgi:hypothetical protein
MKSWIILGLAGFGVYALYHMYIQARRSPFGQGAQQGGYGSESSGIIGLGNTIAPGVPEFVYAPSMNGHGDLIIAAQHNNPLATSSGSPQYQPAFGVDENRGGMEVW